MFIITIHEERWISTYSHIKLIYIKTDESIQQTDIQEIASYKAFKKELKLSFFFTPFTEWKNLYFCNCVTYNILNPLNF